MTPFRKYKEWLLVVCEFQSVVEFINRLSNQTVKSILDHYEKTAPEVYQYLCNSITDTRLQAINYEISDTQKDINLQALFDEAIKKEILRLIDDPLNSESIKTFKRPTLLFSTKKYNILTATWDDTLEFWLPFTERKKQLQPGYHFLIEDSLFLCEDSISKELLKRSLQRSTIVQWVDILRLAKQRFHKIELRKIMALNKYLITLFHKAEIDPNEQIEILLSKQDNSMQDNEDLAYREFVKGLSALADVASANGLLALEDTDLIGGQKLNTTQLSLINLYTIGYDECNFKYHYHLLIESSIEAINKHVELAGCIFFSLSRIKPCIPLVETLFNNYDLQNQKGYHAFDLRNLASRSLEEVLF